jgi:hypothetical protein
MDGDKVPVKKEPSKTPIRGALMQELEPRRSFPADDAGVTGLPSVAGLGGEKRDEKAGDDRTKRMTGRTNASSGCRIRMQPQTKSDTRESAR